MFFSGIYLLISVMRGAEELRAKGKTLETGVANLFHHHLETLVQERTLELSRAKQELQKAHDELELRVKERTEELQFSNAELQRSNADLQQFAYVASHDLQEPLRNVVSCLQMLEKDYKNKLDATADQYIHYAVESSVRMKDLILGLLAYSRVGTRGKPPESADCEQVLDPDSEQSETGHIRGWSYYYSRSAPHRFCR